MRRFFTSALAIVAAMPLGTAAAADSAQSLSVSVRPRAALDVAFVSKDSVRTALTRTDESGNVVVDVLGLSVMGKLAKYKAMAEKCDDGKESVLIVESGAQRPVKEGCRKDEAIAVVLRGGSMSAGLKAGLAAVGAGAAVAAILASKGGSAGTAGGVVQTTPTPGATTPTTPTPPSNPTPTSSIDRRGNYMITGVPISIGCALLGSAPYTAMLLVQGPDASGMNVTVTKASSQSVAWTGNIGSDGSFTALSRLPSSFGDISDKLSVSFNGSAVAGTEEDTFGPTAPSQCAGAKNVFSINGKKQ
jgi:hypothetical protein